MSNLYREELLEYYKNPQNKGTLQDPSIKVHGENPMCGDQLDIELKIEDGIIKQFKFSGESCAVSTISAELISHEMEGKSLEEAKNYTKDDLLELLGMPLTTSRVKCATLSLETLHKAVNEYEQKK